MFATPEQIAHRYYDLFNARLLDETERLIDPEALFHYPSYAQHFVGPAGHRALSQLWLTAFPNLELQILRTRSNGDHTVIADAVARGTHEGPLHLGGLALPATGRRIRVEYQHVLEVRGCRITKVELQLDVEELVRELKS